MSFLRLKPAELRTPELLVLPDGRRRLTRFYGLAHTGVIPPELDLAWGTADDGDAPTAWGSLDLRLTNKLLTDEVPLKGRDSQPMLRLVYEQIHASNETAVGGTEISALEDGRTAKLLNYIQFSTGTFTPGTVGTDTAPGDTSAFLLKVEAPDDGTLRRITRTYVYAGLLAQDDQTKNGGCLLIRTLTYAKTVPSTPSGYTLIGQPVQHPNGLPIYTYTFAKGLGLVVDRIRSRDDGLREETYIALGTRQVPAYGVVVLDESEQSDGYVKYTVTAMQAANGGALTGASLTLPRNVMFTYPGRAKAYDKTLFSVWHALDVFMSPPIEVSIPGQVDITYQTSNSMGTIPTRWQPVEWATIEAAWYGLGGYPQFHIEALRGYRSVDDTPLTHSYGSLDTNGGTMLGQTAFGGSDGVLTCYGGPEDPVGNNYTLDASLEVAFTGTDGTVYYRRTVISATIPSQPALPV